MRCSSTLPPKEGDNRHRSPSGTPLRRGGLAWRHLAGTFISLYLILLVMFNSPNDDTTKLQDCIINQYDMGVSNPNQIAANCDCSESYVKETLNEHRPNWNEDNGFGLL
jgi:hypothetical protein